MLSLLQKFRRKRNPRTSRLPDGWRVYAVGDIHGRADLVRRLHARIARDAEEAADGRNNLIVYLGDYLDRGAHVKETIDELISGLPDGFQARYLQGNHEQLFLYFLEDSSHLNLWLGLGGQATLMSYRVKSPEAGFSPDRAEMIRRELFEAMPQAHFDFLKHLEPFYQMGDYLFVHAGIRPGVPLEKQSPEYLFWARDDVFESGADPGMTIIHGHTIHERVREQANRIGIDTGAYATGILTSAVLEEDRIRFLSTSPVVPRE